MGVAQLGNLNFRLDPEQIHYAYQIDYSTIDTIGGQVIQVLGSTIGDITISGSFGEDRRAGLESWELAESFHTQIKSMMDAQAKVLRSNQGTGQGVTHQPIRFTFTDGKHNWDFKVLIKGIQDPAGGSLQHTVGRANYKYELTLFLVEDSTLVLNKITTDKFIARIARGLGWRPSPYNGASSLNTAIAFIQANSSNGTLDGYFLNLANGQVNLDAQQKLPPAAPAAPGPGSPGSDPNKPTGP